VRHGAWRTEKGERKKEKWVNQLRIGTLAWNLELGIWNLKMIND
jgi:hypothetical protein